MKEHHAAQAKERQKRKPKGSVPENLPEQKGDARDKAGEALQVSGRSVDHAAKVLEQGTPELVPTLQVSKSNAHRRHPT